MRIRRGVRVAGVVQGVGFRPYVYRLATELGLAGWVGNDPAGVILEIEGEPEQVGDFLRRISLEAPPLARVDGVTVEELISRGVAGFQGEFRIALSGHAGVVATQIPADAATCADCLREVFEPNDRRFGYPFTNCTNCGPRFTITKSIPYDRPQTSMAAFRMCAQCQAEYDDPASRRFHAQPNACRECGPRLWLVEASGKAVNCADVNCADPLDETRKRLAEGQIAAIKGIGGFHLAVAAGNEDAVQRLRVRKHRFGKPLAVMVRNLEAARAICEVSEAEAALLTSVARPIVLLRRRVSGGIADSVAPGLPWLGVFLPYAPLHHLLVAEERLPALVMTSANLSDEPIAIENAEALARLGGIADFFLMQDREILQRCDDSVMQVVEGRQQFLRRARGFVPQPVPLPVRLSVEAPALLAVGGHLKNVLCLAQGKLAYQSQHIGDLEDARGLGFFEEALGHLKRTFALEPAVVVHDLHPGYLSTTWARRQGLPCIAVQHHHAHIAACMAEHGLAGPVIGLALDGTGYGSDGCVWGGEVLVAEYAEFRRFGHLRYVAMPGGDAAVREPWRMALAHLLVSIGDAAIHPEVLARLGIGSPEGLILKRMVERGVNSPRTSSCGRLFDAAAALILGRLRVDYEAQAAVELEGAALGAEDDGTGYPMKIVPGDPVGLDAAPLFRGILRDLQSGESAARMSWRFHRAVAEGFCALATRARGLTGLERVCLGGGVIHNRLLVRLLVEGLRREGFAVFLPERVSPGDGGLSYGQVAVAVAQLKRSHGAEAGRMSEEPGPGV